MAGVLPLPIGSYSSIPRDKRDRKDKISPDWQSFPVSLGFLFLLHSFVTISLPSLKQKTTLSSA